MFELSTPTATLLSEIADPAMTRDDVAKTYGLALDLVPATAHTDWSAVNRAIIARWSRSALEYIKGKAWRHQLDGREHREGPK